MTEEEPVETGVTSAVTAGLTPEGVDALRALIAMPQDLSHVRLAQLARDVAQDFHGLDAALKKYGLTFAQYEFLCEHNEFFKNMLKDQVKAWQCVGSTEERVKLQSLLAYEEVLPTIAGRIARQTEELRDVIEGAKMLAKVSGIDTTASNKGTPGERFIINIDLGADTKVTIDATPPLIDITPSNKE